MDFVPCQFCDDPIPFEHYMDHARQCTMRLRPQRQAIQRTTLVFRDQDDGLIYRVFIDDALRALEAAALAPGLADSNAIQEQDSASAENEGNDDENDESDDDDADENGPREHYIGTPQTHRSLVIVPRILMESSFETLSNMEGYEFNMLLSEAIGTVPVGVKNPESVLNEARAQEQCPICYDATTDVETLCGHMYCKPCIVKWLADHKSCPVCKTDLAEECNKKIETTTQNT